MPHFTSKSVACTWNSSILNVNIFLFQSEPIFLCNSRVGESQWPNFEAFIFSLRKPKQAETRKNATDHLLIKKRWLFSWQKFILSSGMPEYKEFDLKA